MMTAGCVTVAMAPPRIDGALTLPRKMPPATLVFVLFRNRLDTVGAAVPGGAVRFFSAWVTLTLPLAFVAAGVKVTDDTVRSARATSTLPVRNVLFVSSASGTAFVVSA